MGIVMWLVVRWRTRQAEGTLDHVARRCVMMGAWAEPQGMPV